MSEECSECRQLFEFRQDIKYYILYIPTIAVILVFSIVDIVFDARPAASVNNSRVTLRQVIVELSPLHCFKRSISKPNTFAHCFIFCI